MHWPAKILIGLVVVAYLALWVWVWVAPDDPGPKR